MSAIVYAVQPDREKSTRDCLDPWFLVFVTARQAVQPCCWHDPVGMLSDGTSLADVLNGPEIRELRRGLLSGNLDSACRNCPARPLTDPASLRRKLLDELADPESLLRKSPDEMANSGLAAAPAGKGQEPRLATADAATVGGVGLTQEEQRVGLFGLARWWGIVRKGPQSRFR